MNTLIKLLCLQEYYYVRHVEMKAAKRAAKGKGKVQDDEEDNAEDSDYEDKANFGSRAPTQMPTRRTSKESTPVLIKMEKSESALEKFVYLSWGFYIDSNLLVASQRRKHKRSELFNITLTNI